MAIMTLCPKCRSIQKAGSICTICKYPIPKEDNMVLSVKWTKTGDDWAAESWIAGDVK